MKASLKGKLYTAIVIALSISVLNGCASLRTKKEGFGAPYEGAAYSFDSMRCLLSDKSASKSVKIILAPVSTVDLIMSSALDTVLLPIDLIASKKDADRFICKDLVSY